MNIDRAWIAAHIPHQGSMCLLDAVQQWDDNTIVCTATSHLARDNPLRGTSGLGITTGIEYAAQAMAVHGALRSGASEAPAVGFLTSVRNVQWNQAHLHSIPHALTVRALRMSATGNSFMYDFSLHADQQLLLQGRASVMQKPVESVSP